MVAQRLKTIAHVIAGQSPSSDDVKPLDEGIPFIQGNAEFGSLHPTPKWECNSATKFAEPGDILISVRAPVGEVNIADSKIGIGRGLAAIRPKDISLSKWLYFALMSNKEYLNSIATGSTFTAVTTNDIGNIRLTIPENPQDIADQLDRELAEIDELIADVQRLERLEQERIVAERDLAFEQSETSVPLRYIAKFITSGSRGWGDYVGSVGSPFMRITNLRRDSVEPDLSNLLYVDTARLPNDEGKRSQLQVGDILISITADLGSVTVVDERIAGGYVSQHLALVRIDTEKYDPYQIAEAILSSRVKNQIAQKSYGGTKAQLNLDDLRELTIPLISRFEPPISQGLNDTSKQVIKILQLKKAYKLMQNLLIYQVVNDA